MKKASAFSLIELSIVILIIGIIIAGVTQSSRLVSEMRLVTARAQTQSSPVSSIKNLVLWLDATSESSLANQNNSREIDEGDTVKYWYDISPQSSAGKSILQSTTGNQPAYIRSAINNLPAVRYNVANPDMRLAGPIGAMSADTTIFMVFKYTSYNTDTNSMIFTMDDATIEYWGSYESSGFKFGVWDGSADIDTHTTVSLSSTAASILSFVYNKNKNISDMYVNGSLLQSTTNSIATTSFDPTASFTLGNHINAPRGIGGDFGEIIIFDRGLRNEEISAIHQYLGKKWNIRID